MRLISLVWLLSMAVGLAGCTREVKPDKDTVLECKLEIKKEDSGILAIVEFKNPTDHSEHVLKEVLLEWVTNAPFIITKDGKYVAYFGRMDNMPDSPPTEPKWWRILEPGESFVTTIRLEDYYDLSAPG